MKLLLILGNQLFPHKHLRKYKDSTIFMCESFDLCTFQKHHKLKLILFLSSMRSYADELKKNKFKVNYIDLKKDFKISYEKKLENFIKKNKFEELILVLFSTFLTLSIIRSGVNKPKLIMGLRTL